MKSDWFVSPEGLSRARLHNLLSREELAEKSGVSLRSIQAYEVKEQRVRLESLQCLAKALSVEVRDIAAVRAAAGAKSAKAMSDKDVPAAATPSVLPPRTPLETLVDLEHDAGIEASHVDTARGRAETLTAKRLQDVLTAYALYDGARFRLTGKVDGMRGLPPDEAALLGSRGGVAARFHIVKDVVPGQPVGVTVHAAAAEHTQALQASYRAGEVKLVLRVVLVEGEPRDDGPGFSSFITRLTTKRPWTFLVEEVAVAGAAGGAGKRAKKKAR